MQNIWILFVVGAFMCWGFYGPTLHSGQAGFTDQAPINKSLRALLCVGGAYFLIAVLVPVITLASKGQLGGFTGRGVLLSTLGGALGAGGAICIILSFRNGGKPFYVMPLVFAGAPIINAMVSFATHPPEGGWRKVNPAVYLGLILAATGAYLILAFKDRPLD